MSRPISVISSASAFAGDHAGPDRDLRSANLAKKVTLRWYRYAAKYVSTPAALRLSGWL